MRPESVVRPPLDLGRSAFFTRLARPPLCRRAQPWQGLPGGRRTLGRARITLPIVGLVQKWPGRGSLKQELPCGEIAALRGRRAPATPGSYRKSVSAGLARQDAVRCDAVQSDFEYSKKRYDGQPDTETARNLAFGRVPSRLPCSASCHGFVQRTIVALPVTHG